ncbi:MAG: hypothetical protein Q8L69_16370 [Gallionellaceae bacterium]|nr:hypothetical protein [Gallionellaceae bacterium]
MKPILPVFCSILFVFSKSSANAAENWVPFQKFSYFVSGKEACRNESVEFLLTQLRNQGRQEAELTKLKEDFYLRIQSRDVIRPFVSENDVFAGINNRWVSVAPGCTNFLLQCKADQQNSCKKISSFPNNQVVTVIFFDEGRLVAKRETYAADVLNIPEKIDFILSVDGGKSWTEIRTPVPVCGVRAGVCELIPLSFSKYTFISTKLNAKGNDFEEVSIHSTADGGKTWVLSIEKWQGVNFPDWVSLSKATMVTIPVPQGHTISISEHDLNSKKTKSFQTSLPPDNWSHPNPGFVIKRDAEYFVQLNESALMGGTSVFRLNQTDVSETQKPVWTSGTARVKDFQVSETAVVLRTWDASALSLVTSRFSEKIHYSLDGGGKWKVLDVPENILDGTLLLSNKRIWLFLPDGIGYLDLPVNE